MRLLFDTNVFLDYLFKRENYVDTYHLFMNCLKQKHQIYVTSMTIRDGGYIAKRFFHDEKKARMLQSTIYEMCTKVIPISVDATINALYSEYSDFEDALIINSAEENMCDAIITSDKTGFKNAKIPTYSPSEINSRLAKIIIS